MATVEDLRDALARQSDALAAFARTSAEQQTATNEALQRLAVVATLGAAATTGPGAGLAVGMTALQTVRKSSEPTVQLSLSDTQYTVSEQSPVGAIPLTGLRLLDGLPETTPDEIALKSEELLDFHRNRGFKVRDAQRTLPDGAWVNDTPDDVDRYRLPSPPLKSLTHSELNRREQSAVTALSRRQWDKRWSYSYNMDEFESIVASSFKKDILKFASYDSYTRGTNSMYYLTLHNRIACWNGITDAEKSDTSGLFIPFRPRGTTRSSDTVQLQVVQATYDRYYAAGDPNVHPGLDNPTHGLGAVDRPNSVLGIIRARHGEATAIMVRDDRSPVLSSFRDRGHIRSDDYCDARVYQQVNAAYKRHQIMSRTEWDVYCEVIGELLLAFSHQHGMTQLACWKELRDMKKSHCDNYAWELLQVIRRALPESDTTKILVLQALFDDMLNKFDAPRHRLSHLIQGLLDVNARILQYGSVSDTEPEDQLLKRVWLKLKIWYRSVPVADSNPLINEWCNFVAQHRYLGTMNAQLRIDEQFLSAYTDIHALLQLAINLETTHAEHVHLDTNPPRFLTVEYSGITDQPAPGNVGHALLTDGDELDSAASLEIAELHAVTGASGRRYDMVDERVPLSTRGQRRQNPEHARGRSPTRRWNQQSGYHEQVGSRGSGSVDQTTSSAANPYRRSSDSRSVASDRSMSVDSDRRRTNVRNAISAFRGRRSASHERTGPGFERSPQSAPYNRNRSAESSEVSVRTVPPVHQRRPWLPAGAYSAVNEIVAKSDEALKAPTDAANLARVLREVKAHAASCLQTYLCEPPSVSFSDGVDESKTDVSTSNSTPDHPSDVPSEIHSLATTVEQQAFATAHKRLCMVGYDNTPEDEQDSIIENLFEEMGLMTEVITETTRASGLDFEALQTEAITSNLIITLMHCGLSVSQICAIYDTGASKPFVKTVRECIKGILVALPASATVTTATSNASAVSISLRRYNFAITSDMVDVAARVGIDISKYDVVTVLAAPLVCADFQHDFDIVSAPVFKDLGIIMEQGRGHHESDFLSLHEKPNLRTKMGHRTNGLPVLFLVPDCIVEDHRLRRLQHHTLTTYSDAEGIRLLKEQWELSGSSSAYVTALDECYTAALLSGGPQRSVCESSLSDPLFSERRSSGKEHSCLKVAYNVDGFDDISEDDELFYVWFHDPMPQFVSPHVLGDTHIEKQQHLHTMSVSSPDRLSKNSPKLTVALLGSGLSSELFFDELPLEVKVAIEPKADLQQLVHKHSPNTKIFSDVRTVVDDLERGSLKGETIRTDIVSGTMPCYEETSLAIYNNRETPHEDGDLFRNYLLRYVSATRPRVVLAEMTPPHAANGMSHHQVVKELEKLGYQVVVTDRLPSCFCGDATHRDRWFVLAFLEFGPSFSIHDYCDKVTKPASSILDPIDKVDPKLEVMHPVTFRTKGQDNLPWGSDYANDSKVAGQYISRSSVAGYVGGSHAKEDKFYSIESPLPCITRYGVQIHDTRIAPNHVRFASLSELVRASTLSKEQLEHLSTLPQHAAMSRLANAVPAGTLFTVYACIVDQLSLRDNNLGAHVFNISDHPDDEQFACCQTLGDLVLDADFLPDSVYRHEVDLFSTESVELGAIDPNAELSDEPVPLTVTAQYSRKSVDLSSVPIYRPPSKEFYAAQRRMDAWHAITHVRDPQTIEHMIQSSRGHGLRPGDSRYLSTCDLCDHNIETTPRKHKSPTDGLRSAPPNVKPGQKWMLDGGDATVRSKWGGCRYFLVFIDVATAYCVLYYMRDNSARSFVSALKYLDRLVRTMLHGTKIDSLYGDFFSTHLDQHVLGALRADMGWSFEVTPPYCHWLNPYCENFIRVLKVHTRIRLHSLIGKTIDGQVIKDATPWWNFAMEHARQSKMAEPSSSAVKQLGVVATREQNFKQDHDTPTFVRLHPFW